MKKLFTLIAFVFAVCSLQAQFTMADFPTAGDSEYYTSLDTTGIVEGPGGTGVTWDYSGATVGATNMTISYVLPSSHPQGSAIPGATVVLNQSDGNYVFYNVTADSVVNVGEQSITSQPCDYNPLQGTLIRFPASVGATVTDSLYGEYFDGFLTNVTRWGIVTTIVDGSGTLLTPTVTWNNVTRVYSHYQYRDSSWTGAAISDIHFFRYEWYTSGRRTPVFTTITRLVSLNQGPYTEERKIWFADTTAVGIEEGMVARELNVSPNPSEGIARISYQLDAAEEVKLSVFNLMGQEVIGLFSGVQESGSHSMDMDASGLGSGIYFVRLQAGDAVINRKVVIH